MRKLSASAQADFPRAIWHKNLVADLTIGEQDTGQRKPVCIHIILPMVRGLVDVALDPVHRMVERKAKIDSGFDIEKQCSEQCTIFANIRGTNTYNQVY
jgi:hypothetical protein